MLGGEESIWWGDVGFGEVLFEAGNRYFEAGGRFWSIFYLYAVAEVFATVAVFVSKVGDRSSVDICFDLISFFGCARGKFIVGFPNGDWLVEFGLEGEGLEDLARLGIGFDEGSSIEFFGTWGFDEDTFFLTTID